jgi:hypothetical protein
MSENSLKNIFLTKTMSAFGFMYELTLMKTVACFVMNLIALIVFSYAASGLMNNPEFTPYNIGIVSKIFQGTTIIMMLSYVILLLCSAGTMLLNVVRKDADIPMPPTEEFCVDLMVFTIAGCTLSISTMFVNNLILCAIFGILVFITPIGRIVRHLKWWVIELPFIKKVN